MEQQRGHEPWYRRFHRLMPHRVREVLLVSSPYDAFILEEDGHLSTQMFLEYSALELSQAPRITHAATGEKAMELLASRQFEMVIAMVHLADIDVKALARQIKMLYQRLPVVVFAFSESELQQYSTDLNSSDIDRVFVWTGDTRMLVAAIKLIEDQMNVDADIKDAGVRVVIVVEDSVGRYSSFLSLFYTELLQQASSLIAEGLNDLHKRLRMRARPRILLATNFEEALEHYKRYKSYLFAVITDVRYPRNGVEDANAGLEFARLIREEDPDLPILLQSAEKGLGEKAKKLNVSYAEKNSTNLGRQIRWFLKEGLGFGDFIFRLPNRREVGRARNVYEMEKELQNVPGESIAFHASRNHFSLWLMARSMLRLAEQLRPRRASEFEDIESMRTHLIGVLRKAREQERQGAITDFSAQQDETNTPFVRLGSGSIGGKGRGIAFVNATIVRNGLEERFPDLKIRIPRTVAIGTDAFDRFIEDNALVDLEDLKDREVLARFLKADFSEELLRDLKMACLWEMKGPLAVRSSSLLEDSQLNPFAGIYSTYMLPNNHPDPTVRLNELCNAIKAVYASIYSNEARAYTEMTVPMDEEKMGIVIQECVGQQFGERFYPHFSGVALSYNFYPFGAQRANEGICALALGLGQTIVGGGNMMQFSPHTPQILPQFPTAKHFLKYSQTKFYALDLSRNVNDLFEGENDSLELLDLSEAEKDGTLAAVGSVYRANDDAISDSLRERGPRLVTFNNILKWGAIPLSDALTELLDIMHRGMGQPVEIEFAVDMGDWGRSPDNGNDRKVPCLYLLQVRPQSTTTGGQVVVPKGIPKEYLFSKAAMSLGYGVLSEIEDIIYVKDGATANTPTPNIAMEIGELNAKLLNDKRPYLLIGPGRWGSSDPFLGIPVQWNQISGTRVIIELPLEERAVEPSQGSHFFHNITSRNIGYLTVSKVPERDDPYIDHQWLIEQPLHDETKNVGHIRLDSPLKIFIDGQRGTGMIYKPDTPSEMDIKDWAE